MPPKKRKLSDLSTTEANLLLHALSTFQSLLDEQDDEVPQGLSDNLVELRRKIEGTKHTPLSKADSLTLVDLKLSVRSLALDESRRQEIETIGAADTDGNTLSFGTTTQLIRLIRNHVSLATEAGCRVLINLVLLRLVSSMKIEGSSVNIIPEFPIAKTTFGSEKVLLSFSGVVDYLLTVVPETESAFILSDPVDMLANPDWSFTPTIIEAKKENITQAIPQAAVSAASYCKQHQLNSLRGCITTGDEWLFFLYTRDLQNEDGGKFYRGLTIKLEGNLALILGLLNDMVKNAVNPEQTYFEYK